MGREERSVYNHVTRWFQHLQANAPGISAVQQLLPHVEIDQEYVPPAVCAMSSVRCRCTRY
jgi:hypothetical protein